MPASGSTNRSRPRPLSIALPTSLSSSAALFDLTTLLRELNKSHGLSAADTLAATQTLYESKLVTYPRTDSRYLGSDMKSRVPKILEQLKAIRAEQIKPLNLDKLPFSKRIIDDAKVTDHHAIIPTGILPKSLAPNEQIAFEAITTQFIAAFYPPCLKKITTVDGAAAGIAFQAKGTQIVEPGWTLLFPAKGKKHNDDEESDEDQLLPDFRKGEQGPHHPSVREGKTKPPRHFTENSLLGAMEAAGKWVEDDALREALKERGIGTPATRAAIIETLLKRHYIQRDKKLLLATEMGRCLIALIQDPLLKSPELTGEWEEKLKRIERGELPAAVFMEGIADYAKGLVASHSTNQFDTNRWGPCPLCGEEVIKGKSAYGCSGWKKGCPFVIQSSYKDLTLTPNQIQVLLQMNILPYSVRIDDQPRLLALSRQGFLFDTALPAAHHQKNAPA